MQRISKIGVFLAFIGAVVVSVLFLSFTVTQPIVEQRIIQEKRTVIPVVGDANPGTNVTGFFYVMIYPHQPTPATAYASNLSNASAYEYSDSYNTSMTGQTPFSTTFDIVVKVGGTCNDVSYSNNQTWNPNYAWMLMTCTDLGITADSNMTELLIGQNNTGYCWIHYYLNNATAGYQINEGASYNITSCKFYVSRLTS
jgi:hypothetical protein